MTKQDAMREIVASNVPPEIDNIYILEETDKTPVRVVTWVKGHLTKSTYDDVTKALTGSIYLFKVSKVRQHKYMDWDYNMIRIHTHSIDGELRCMTD